jgi:iron complex outermembrane recepter protein
MTLATHHTALRLKPAHPAHTAHTTHFAVSAIATAIALLAPWAATHATAQTTSSPTPTRPAPERLDTIEVRAEPDYTPEASVTTQSATPALEVPFSASSVGRRLLADRGVTQMNDALSTVASTAAIRGIGDANARYRFRGFLAGTQLKNGFRQGTGFAVVDFQNVETLEVMRGAASALYGRFEPGGVLNVVTKRPTATRFAEVGVNISQSGQREITLDTGGGLGGSGADAPFRTRLNASFEDSSSYRDEVNKRNAFLAPSLRWQLSPNSTLEIDLEHADRRSVFDRGFVIDARMLNLPPERFLGDSADRFDTRTASQSLRWSYRWSPQLAARIGFMSTQAQAQGDYFFPIGTTPLVSATGMLSRRLQATDDRTTENTWLAQLHGEASLGATQHQWLVGLERNSDRADSRIVRATTNSLIDINAPVYGVARAIPSAVIIDTRADNETNAVIAQNEMRWGAARLTAGVRHESVDSSLLNRVNTSLTATSASATTARVGAGWMLTNALHAFGSWSESFAPQVSARPLVAGESPRPTRGKQTELGIKSAWLDGRLNASLTGFEVRRIDARVADAANAALDRQVGEQRSEGFEVEVNGRITPNTQIVAAHTDMRTRVVRDTAALTGKRIAGAPERSTSLWLRHDLNSAWGLGAGWQSVGARFVDPANTFALPAYERFDLAVFWRPARHLHVQANLVNAGNTRYFENGNTTGNYYPGEPRSLRLSGVVRW